MTSPANSSLRPAWHRGSQSGGRGFQPPPTVASERVRSGSGGGGSDQQQQQQQQKQQQNQNVNKFAALDDDEDIAAIEQEAEEVAKRVANSRSEALRSSSTGVGRSNSNKPGRSLADLAARVPTSRERSASFGSTGERSAGGGAANASSRLSSHVSSSSTAAAANEANVIRFTRERLLSMRPKPLDEPPEQLKILDEQIDVVVTEKAQDPVCWDTFDAEAIWATVPRRSSKAAEGTEGRRGSTRREIGSSGSGRWQRGVALPPQDQAKKAREADNPSDLWDDPQATGAASDFSAFGAMPTEDEPFDFEKMAEATRKFEEELHGSRSRASSEAESDGKDENVPTRRVNSHRPLASVGTTIQSGSGDNVNVFEDFDDPAVEDDADANENKSAIKSGTEDKNASSRLMAMIGVKKEPETTEGPEPTTSAWGGASPEPPKPAATAAAEDAAPVPLNPWGGPLLPGQGETQPAFDLQARMREAELEKAREQEEAQRRAAAAQQQAEEQARKAASMQQQDGVQSRVELVLMERISTILENSWGQSDLSSILSTMHSEDSRVIPLLSNTDALRALILRNPQRIALRSNPVFGTEMAALLLTNAQWQQQQSAQQQQQQSAQQQQQQPAQQQQAALRSQQEELQRQQAQQRQLQQQRQQEKAAAAAAAVAAVPPVVDGAPWYYSDPQSNIQGPFRGEEMRQWLEAGYFKADLPISQQQTGPFFPLSNIFPDLTVAFVSPRASSADQEAGKARIEAERAAEAAKREEAERQARGAAERERLAHEAAERERQAREEAERRAQSQAKEDVNEPSNQLKMMLGVRGSTNAVASEAPASKEKRGPKGSNKNSQQQKVNDVAPVPQPPQAKQASPAAPAWGGASKPVTRKSMSEIQKEEARAAAIAAMNREGGRSSGSGWANVAASRGGSTGWQGGAAQQRPAAVVPMQPAPVAQTRVPQPQIAQVAAANAQLSTRSQKSQPTSTTPADEFGAKMSPALEKWCKDQMMKLNGTDDLTLVSFCMTLTDPIEIRQYLTTYLGSNAQVNSFATEFINKKSGVKAQEEWESTVVTKKSRKKKSGGR